MIAASEDDPNEKRMRDIAEQQKELTRQRRKLANDMRNEDRKRVRLIEKAKGLSRKDLLGIVAMQSATEAKKEAKAQAKAVKPATKAKKAKAGDGGGPWPAPSKPLVACAVC